ncbi:MAG: alpha/beta hydrolase [Candidatus Odinarchaeum yellowstonii]|uniref:Alpha/beta hydrolase n=1 Tax=Odinarchaeota yellowstonii (strain LCB_4) TaxID=1841599 RepID=A0AAF0D2E9_ODILC|nr:MAG: alpha/beta hydrolase [Candidatus Odinarchaeum yellowstonii]
MRGVSYFKKIHLTFFLIGLVILTPSIIVLATANISNPALTMCAVADDGVQIAFDVIKKPSVSVDAPVVILLHGFSGNRKMMKMIGLALADRNFISVLVDLRGHGDSGGSIGSVNRFEADIQAVLTVLNNSRIGDINKLVFIGHSMGGSVAVNMSSILQPLATIGIAPAISPNDVNLTTPKNLLLIISEKDFIIDNQAVIAAFYKAINNTGEPNTIYFAGGSEKKLFVDDSSDHLSILYKAEVINEIVKWVTRTVSGVEEASNVNPDLIGASVLSTLISGLLIILPALHLLLKNLTGARSGETSVPLSHSKRKIYLLASLGFIAASLGGVALTLLFSPILFVISPLLFTNFVTSLFLGNSVSLGILCLILIRRRIGGLGFKKYFKEKIGGQLFYNVIVGFTSGLSLIILFYVSIGFNTTSTFSIYPIRLILLLLYFPLYFCVFLFYELFFRGFLREELGSNAVSNIILSIIQIIMIISSLLLQMLLVALTFQQNIFSFLLLGLPLIIILVSVSTSISVLFYEASKSWLSQIISNALLLCAVAVALSNIIYLF